MEEKLSDRADLHLLLKVRKVAEAEVHPPGRPRHKLPQRMI
jgi:hypothetical protein